MSHKVTFKSTITDDAILRRMFTRLNIPHKVTGTSYRVSGSRFDGATIDPSKGTVTGDSDWVTKDTIQQLNQAYSEEEVLAKIELQGASIESREVDRNGSIILMCRMHG